jgi:hypothetical protein
MKSRIAIVPEALTIGHERDIVLGLQLKNATYREWLRDRARRRHRNRPKLSQALENGANSLLGEGFEPRPGEDKKRDVSLPKENRPLLIRSRKKGFFVGSLRSSGSAAVANDHATHDRDR